MSETTTPIRSAADIAALLSAWWSRPVAEQVKAWTQTWAETCRLATERQLDLDRIDALASAAHQALDDALVDEYERLFVGPGHTPCPPYESLWRTGQSKLEQGRLMSEASADVASLYRSLGLAVASRTGELPDHIAVELEALAFALRQDDDDANGIAVLLLDDHLRAWLPAFCASVAEHTTQPFYAALAALTPTWVEALRDGLSPS